MKELNEVVTSTPPSGIRKFFDVAQRMRDVVSLGVGEPDYVTPWRIREAAIYSLERGYTTYTSNAGLPRLRESISSDVSKRYGVTYPIDDIIITVGVSEGLDLALRTIVNPGDEVVYFSPSYVSYIPTIRLAGGTPVAIHTRGEHGFELQVEEVEAAITPRTKALLLSYPSNPTGTVQPRAKLQALVDLAVKHDLYIVSDEIYDRLTYVGQHTCIASLPGATERTVLLNGFSKAYAMTGWRVAYACAPAHVAEAMLKVHQYTMLCAPHMSQMAAIEALEHGEQDVQQMVIDYDRRRRFFVNGLNSIGLTCPLPGGAFYAFPSIAASGLSSEEFAQELLDDQHVAVVPGNVFGPSGEGHIRCSYATGLQQLEQALARMRTFLEKRGVGPA